MRFVDRGQELEVLDRMWSMEDARFLVLYGARDRAVTRPLALSSASCRYTSTGRRALWRRSDSRYTCRRQRDL